MAAVEHLPLPDLDNFHNEIKVSFSTDVLILNHSVYSSVLQLTYRKRFREMKLE